MNPEEVKEYMASEIGCPIEKTGDMALIEFDLGVTGDDAFELFWEIYEEYQADFSSCDMSLCFSLEAGSVENKCYGHCPVTIKHLIDSVMEGTG